MSRKTPDPWRLPALEKFGAELRRREREEEAARAARLDTRAAGDTAAFSTSVSRRRGRDLPRPARSLARMRLAISLLAAAVTLGAVAAVAETLWNPILGDSRRGRPRASTTAPPSNELARLGVLRRPATPADHGVSSTYALRLVNSSLQGVRTAYVRLLGSDAGGRGFVLIPVERYVPSVSGAAGVSNALCLFGQDVDGGGLGCYSLAQILAGQAVGSLLQTASSGSTPLLRPGTYGYGRARLAVRSGVIYGLVPDGIASVKVIGAQGSVVVAVHENFFETVLPYRRSAASPFRTSIVWLNSQGHRVAMSSAG